jgi:hypothetical protein
MLRRWDRKIVEHPTPPGNSDGYQNKGVARKAIRIVMKTNDE